jgi:Trm5-related predicted tRNA methylase
VKAIKEFDRIYSLHLTCFTGQLKDAWERCGVSKLLSSKHECPIEDLELDLQNTIYLSPDSEDILDSFDPEITNFIVGGIVDRSVTKNMTYEKAKAMGVRC